MNQSKRGIIILKEQIINQIAAGEVVQKPASVVKELTENAIDAQATTIDIVIQNAGKTLIQVIDDGQGIYPEDVSLAFERHATSKIYDINDIYDLYSYGFRGEALASIAAVSRVEMFTRPEDRELGTHALVENSKILKIEPAACSKGTNILVKDLFFSVPARRNFLKSDNMEMRNIWDEFYHVAIPNHNISFSLTENNELKIKLLPTNLKQRIIDVLGKQYDSKLLYIEEEFPFATIKGFISNPTAAKKTRDNQYFYANGRYFRSPYFHQMIMKAYEGLIEKETFPAYVFFITLPPNRLDVNVHPSKTEIKFQDEHLIAASINSLTKKALGISGLAPDIDFDAIPTHIFSINSSKSDFNFSKNNYPFPQNPLTDTSQLFKQKINLQRDIIDENYKDLFKEINLIEKDLNLNVDNLEFQIIENRILITKMKDGVLIGDIEAILERLIFERLSQNKNNINSESQQVLFPIVINIEAKFLGTFLSLQTLLENIGFKFEKISNNQFQAIGVPAHGYIIEEDIEDFIYQLLELPETGAALNMDKLFIKLATQGAKKQLSNFTIDSLDNILSELFSLADPKKGLGGKNNFIILSSNNLLQLIQSYE
jgi:DNA mismatch repair protein MutL